VSPLEGRRQGDSDLSGEVYLVGYFLPHEGTSYEAWGVIAFESLAAYETYRGRLKADPKARANFQHAEKARFVVREERTFVEVVEGTFALPRSAS
jgi:hypothetical protein